MALLWITTNADQVRRTIPLQILLLTFYQSLSSATTGVRTLNSETLQHVQILFRHGARNPTHTYPTNPYTEADFSGGWGQLTESGVEQMHELGRFLRFRYDSFINQEYSQYETYMLSSDTDRTISSGLALTSTLFSSTSKPKNGETSSCPVTHFPIRTIANEDDDIIGNRKPCPKYQELLEEFVLNSEITQKLNEENSDLLSYVNEYSGLNLSRFEKSFVDFHDGLVILEENNLQLPNWTQPFYNTEHVLGLVEQILRFHTATDELLKLRLSPLLKVLLENINSKINGNQMSQPPIMTDSRRKMILFSGHDYTLVHLMRALGVSETVNIRPIYGSALMIELHKNVTTEHMHYIKLYYSNDTTKEPFEVPMPGYGSSISIQSFLEAIQPVLLSQDWDTACVQINMEILTNQNTSEDKDERLGPHSGIGLSLLVLVSLILSTVVFVNYYIQKSRFNGKYVSF